MAEGLCEIASDKKRNAHFFQRMDEWERIFWIGAGAGPEHRDLKREGFWKLLEWVEVPVSDVEQGDFFGSQGRRGLGGKFPNRGWARTNATPEARLRKTRFNSRILRIFMALRENMDLSMRQCREKARKRKARTYRARSAAGTRSDG